VLNDDFVLNNNFIKIMALQGIRRYYKLINNRKPYYKLILINIDCILYLFIIWFYK